MQHISIYYEDNSDDLVTMVQELGDPGVTIGNEGMELAVTDSEYQQIVDYVTEHPEITVERYGTISDENVSQMKANI